MDPISTFFFFGTLDLLILTYQDLKTTWVDDRINSFMLGIVVFLSSFSRPWSLLIGFVIVEICLRFLKKFSYKNLGEGDISAMRWIYLGFYLISPLLAAISYLVFVAVFLFQFSIMKILEHMAKIEFKKHLPLFPVIFLSWALTIIIHHNSNITS